MVEFKMTSGERRQARLFVFGARLSSAAAAGRVTSSEELRGPCQLPHAVTEDALRSVERCALQIRRRLVIRSIRVIRPPRLCRVIVGLPYPLAVEAQERGSESAPAP